MNSVPLAPHGIGQRTPGFRETVDLLGFDGMVERDPFEQHDLVGHQVQVRNWPLPCPCHVGVSGEGLTGEDDALIGFGGGHGGMLP